MLFELGLTVAGVLVLFIISPTSRANFDPQVVESYSSTINFLLIIGLSKNRVSFFMGKWAHYCCGRFGL